MSEFSRIIEIKTNILNNTFTIEASVDELLALANRFEVSRIENLNVKYLITEKTDILGAYVLVASIKSKVVEFIVDGEEEGVDINEKFDVVLVTEDMARNNFEELREFDIEIFYDEKRLDVGEIAAQYLSLCIFM